MKDKSIKQLQQIVERKKESVKKLKVNLKEDEKILAQATKELTRKKEQEKKLADTKKKTVAKKKTTKKTVVKKK